MKTPKLPIDFNEMITCDLILLSKTDKIKDAEGQLVVLKEDMKVVVFMEDWDEHGQQDDIRVEGRVELNDTGIALGCKWNFRVGEKGIKHESDLK